MNEQVPLKNLQGKIVGGYRIEQLVEENELGTVYRASSQTSEFTYRLRVLRSSSTITPESRIVFLGQFQQQARELVALLSDDKQAPKHPHLLPLVDFGNIQGNPYLVSLQTPMKQFTEFLIAQKMQDMPTIGLYLDQIASALEYAHHHATLHRDLSSNTVYMRDDGSIVVADLGVMRILELTLKTDLRTLLYAHSLFATPAPEQLLNQPKNTYTDVYALGALLYRMLTGHRVYSASTRAEIAEQHLNTPVPPLATWRRVLIGQRDITPELDKLIAAAMAKDTQQRIQHPADLANAYHQIISAGNTTRQPIVSSLAQKIAEHPAKEEERVLQSNAPMISERPAKIRDTRRRTLIFIGGGAVVAVGTIALIADQLLSKQEAATTSNGAASGSSASTIATSSTNANGSANQLNQAAISGNIVAHTSAVALNSAISFKNPHSNSQNPAVLVHLSNNQFVAFDSTCPHAGCPVSYKPQEKLLVCPCHDALFDPAKQAAVVQGPANSPLTPVPITVHSDGSITTV